MSKRLEKKNLTHRSAWYSPRGFCNEGTYLYGTTEEMKEFFDEKVAGDANCGWGSVKHHTSVETARTRCETDAQKDINRHKRNAEISSIGAEAVIGEIY